MFKKLVIGIVLVLVVFGVFIGVRLLTKGSVQKEEEILKNALTLGEIVVDMYRSEVTQDNLVAISENKSFSKGVLDSFEEHQNYLDSLDDSLFNLTEYYNNLFENSEESISGPDQEAMDNPDKPLFEEVGEEHTPYKSIETEDIAYTEEKPDSSFIQYDGETAYIKVKEISTKEKEVYVTYKGVTFGIPQKELPQTYESIKSNTKYLYSYTNYMFDKNENKFVDLQYTSVKDPSEVKIVRVYYDKNGTITSFIVR